MTDNPDTPDTDDDETIELDASHPWIQAALISGPQPVQSVARLEPCTLTINGKELPAAMLTIIDPTGVKNAYLPPAALAQMMEQAGAIFQLWDQKQAGQLVVADKNMEKMAKAHQDAIDDVSRVFRR